MNARLSSSGALLVTLPASPTMSSAPVPSVTMSFAIALLGSCLLQWLAGVTSVSTTPQSKLCVSAATSATPCPVLYM